MMRIQQPQNPFVTEHTAITRRALAWQHGIAPAHGPQIATAIASALARLIGNSFASIFALLVAGQLLAPVGVFAQSTPPAATQGNAVVTEHLAAGDKATTARQPLVALQQFEAALQLAPRNYEALWKASGAAIDLGEAEKVEEKREALYAKANGYAQRALDINADGADANFAMARAVGRKALTVGPRDRVKFAKEVQIRALKALAADPKHPGAMHVMGVWNAEIMRLNSITRLVAKTVLGGQVFSTASWASAVSYMEQSVANDPERAVHRLDLARVYRDVGRKADARAAYEATLKAPLKDANDELYQRQAAEELRALK